MHDNDWVVMGYVCGAFGVKGWVKVHADTERLTSLLDYPIWHVGQPDGVWQGYELEEGNQQGKTLVVHLKGFSNREQALTLKGLAIKVPRDQLPATKEDEYYWVDLMGMSVSNPKGDMLGVVSGVLKTPAHDILKIKDGNAERLIPFVSAIIEQVDTVNHCIVVKWESDY